jgi:hypothetical protein
VLDLWIERSLSASDLASIIRLGERYGNKRFAYAVALAKRRIGRLWDAY